MSSPAATTPLIPTPVDLNASEVAESEDSEGDPEDGRVGANGEDGDDPAGEAEEHTDLIVRETIMTGRQARWRREILDRAIKSQTLWHRKQSNKGIHRFNL